MANLGQTLQQLKAMKAMSQTQGRASPAEILRSVDAFGTNPGALRMKMYAPQTLEAGAALVVVLHGCTQTASGYAGPAGWLALAARYNFVIVAPEQRRENNPNLCFNWFEPGDIKRAGGEAQSIAEMVRYAVNKHQLDPGRVFVTGLSAGGAMTCVMLATYPELFAGGAVVAGLAYGSAKSVTDAFAAMSASVTPDAAELAQRVRRATDHPGPWPKVAVWHGAADQIVRPAAGEAVAAQWRALHDANGCARTARTPDGRTFDIWLDPAGEPVVELHRIAGMGHGAPIKARGDGRCGAVSAFTHDVGVASAYEIALGWGLATSASRHERDSAVVDEASGPQTEPDPQDRLTAVINDALRTAGLLR